MDLFKCNGVLIFAVLTGLALLLFIAMIITPRLTVTNMMYCFVITVTVLLCFGVPLIIISMKHPELHGIFWTIVVLAAFWIAVIAYTRAMLHLAERDELKVKEGPDSNDVLTESYEDAESTETPTEEPTGEPTGEPTVGSTVGSTGEPTVLGRQPTESD
jgi:hypothetical protein